MNPTKEEGLTEAGAKATWPDGVLRTADLPAGARWLNWLMVRRREHRGDLVGTIAWWSFVAMLFILVLGGSQLSFGAIGSEWLQLKVPALDWKVFAALLGPVVAHAVKGIAGK